MRTRLFKLLVPTLVMLALLLSGVLPAIAGPGAAPARYIVVMKPGADADAVARGHGVAVSHVYTHALNGFAAPLSPAQFRALAIDPRVAYVEADQEVHLFVQTVPTGIQRIFADDNANVTIDGNDDLRIDVDVAVIDTGIDLDHADLNVVASVDCSGGSPFKQSCGSGGDDDHGHGTHVAGTIGAIDNGFGVVGVAPGARLWAVKVLRKDGSGYVSWIVAGIDYVTAHADQIEVANMSLGFEGSSDALDQAITNSVAAGVVYAVAAGNSDKDASTFSPANHPDVITVSALADFDGEPGGEGEPTCRDDQDDTLADFSNWGSLIEVTAPGVCILSTWLGGDYNTISGTSMASPHVAGAAALLASGANDPASKADVDAIIATIINEGNFDWTDDSGDGIKEPLLDVSNSTEFAPATVAGSSAPTDSPPSVSIASPADGSTVSGSITIQVYATDAEDEAGTLIVEVSIDGGVWETATYNSASDYYELDWDTTAVADGSHTIDARATDSAANTGYASQVTVTVDNVDDPPTASIINPADGSTVSGVVTIQVDASDDRDAEGTLTVEVSIDGGAWETATYNSASGYYELDWDTTTVADGSHIIDARATDSVGNTTNAAQITVTVDNSTPSTMHVGDLDGTSINQGSTWKATVTITVHDANENPVADATVSGTWSGGYEGSGSCGPTDSNGQCSVTSGSIHKRYGSVTFTVDNVTHATLSYESAHNHDPDGDSDGTSITVFKP